MTHIAISGHRGLPKETAALVDRALRAALAERGNATSSEHVIRLDVEESTAQAHHAASERMLDEADELLAVWDGMPARGYGFVTRKNQADFNR